MLIAINSSSYQYAFDTDDIKRMHTRRDELTKLPITNILFKDGEQINIRGVTALEVMYKIEKDERKCIIEA